jgi:hypothetical protein
LSDQLCHLCGAESVPATFACHSDTDSDPYTHIYAHGHLDFHAYLDIDFYGYTNSHRDAQPDGHAYSNEHADRNRDADHGPTDGYSYPIALGHSHHRADGYSHRHADGYIHHPHAHDGTTAPHGDALAAPRGLARQRVGQQAALGLESMSLI